MEKRLISSYFSSNYDSLSYYQYLNFLDYKLTDDLLWDTRNLSWSQQELDIEYLNLVTYAILCSDISRLVEKEIELNRLSVAVSTKYFQIISNGSNELEFKLKCQRLNYLIQYVLDAKNSRNYNAQCINEVPYYYPWDILQLAQGLIVIESKDNVKLGDKYLHNLSKKGLMLTQVDFYKHENKILFSSCYSGCYVICNSNLEDWSFYPKNGMLFTFYFEDKFFEITKDLKLLQQGELVSTLAPLEKPWRFKIKGDKLLIFDWFELSSFFIFDLKSNEGKRIKITETLIPHDVEMAGDLYYFLDKQQGAVFIYDKDFRFLEKRLSFGYGENKLCDPIGIKANEKNLMISSWLSGKIIKLPI